MKRLVYLVRHGDALSEEQDPQRPLSAEGEAEVAKVAAFLKPLGLKVGAIWHSGKPRAEGTARLLDEAVRSARGVVRKDGLLPEDPVKPICRELEESDHDLLLAGHQPFMGALTARLITGDETREVVAFPKSAIACLERIEKGRWCLLWLITPELLK